MSKKNNVELTFVLIFTGCLLAIAWLIDKDTKNKKKLIQKQRENDKLKNGIHILDTELNNWKHSYLSQQSWYQEFQHIPNPQESIKDLIVELEKLKREVFHQKPDFTQEIDDCIHALKGEKLNVSLAILAKILENQLKAMSLENKDFCNQFKTKIDQDQKKINWGDCMKFIEKQKYFKEEDVAFLKDLQKNRNTIVHEIAPERDESILINFHRKAIATIVFVEFETCAN